MALFTENDMLEYMPDLHNHGIQDFSDMIAKTDDDVYRLLRVEWWPKLQGRTSSLHDFDTTKLKDSQLTRSAVYYCLYKYVLPKLTQWSPEGDSFQTQIAFYKNAFDEEFSVATSQLNYDFDADGVHESHEQEIQPAQRLVR
jgi:hypothetical protein